MWKKTNLASSLLLAGWALYITVVTASNLSDLFWSFHWENWAFRSGNLAYIATATRIYFKTEQANQALLALVIVWEGTAVVFLGLAALRWARGGEAALACARRGLVLLGLLWFGFAISAELFVAYDRGVNESAYWILATAVLATMAVLEIWASLRRAAGTGSTRPGRRPTSIGPRLCSRRLAVLRGLATTSITARAAQSRPLASRSRSSPALVPAGPTAAGIMPGGPGLPQIVVGTTRMKCAGTPSIHGSSPASMNGARSDSVSR